MLLKTKQSNNLVKISEIDRLINPFEDKVQGRIQAGQNEQLPEDFKKQELLFPSGENLPKCWLDSDY